MKVAIFDSGMGGLSVLHQAAKLMPAAQFIYYADVEHVPYGEKTREEISSYVDEAVSFCLEQGAEAVVIACNTATSVTIEALRRKYDVPIIGMEPAVKPAVQNCPGKRVLVTATPLTIREEKLKHLLSQVDNSHRSDLLPLPGLVRFAEAMEFDEEKVGVYLQKAIDEAGYRISDYGAVVLGCTHFNYFRDTFRSLFGAEVQLIDGSYGTAVHLNHMVAGASDRVNAADTRFACSYFYSGKAVDEAIVKEKFAALLQRLEKMSRI